MKIFAVLFINYMCYFQSNEASTVSFQAFPSEIKENLTEFASMMCHVVDNVITRSASSPLDVHHISSIFITRGDGDDVASVTAFDPPTALADFGNLQVKGGISAASGEGSLELSWTEPSKMAVGEYTCNVNAIDTKGHPVVLSTQLMLTSVTPSVMDLIDNLNLKVNNIQQENSKQQQENSKQQQENSKQQQVISIIQQENIKQQQVNIKQQQVITKQEQLIQKQQQDIQQLQTKMQNCSHRVAFQAAIDSTKSFRPGQTLIYDTTMLNEGNAFNPATGAFTCVVPGLYLFNAHVLSDRQTSHDLGIQMRLNTDIVSSVIAGHNDVYESGSMSATVLLKAGDVVTVYSYGTSHLYWESYIPRSNVFSGHLIKSDGC